MVCVVCVCVVNLYTGAQAVEGRVSCMEPSVCLMPFSGCTSIHTTGPMNRLILQCNWTMI